MKWKDRVVLSRQQLSDIEHKLRYVEFTSRRYASLSCDSENVRHSLYAIARLSGWEYTPERLAMLMHDEAHGSHHDGMIQRYYNALLYVMTITPDVSFDESLVMQLYNRVWGDNSSAIVASSTARRTRVADILSQSLQQYPHRHTIAVHPQLSSSVEWLLQQLVHDGLHDIVSVVVFLYDVVTQDTFDSNRGEMMHLLSILLLRHVGMEWVVSYAPCRVMVERLIDYRKALYSNKEGGGGLSQWVELWVDVLHEAARCVVMQQTSHPYTLSISHKEALNTRQLRILNYIDKNQPVKIADIVAHLHKESKNTIKKDLLLLRERGYIVADGVLKGTLYYKV